MSWVKVESKSHPGLHYYYNRVSKTSTWERPPELGDREIPSHPSEGSKKGKGEAVADLSADKPVENAWGRPERTGDRKCHEKKIHKAVESDIRPLKVKQKGTPCESSMARAPDTEKGAEDMEEAMEVVVEKWGEEEEIAMDIDVSQEDIADMQVVRNSQSSPSQLDIKSFGIPSDYSNDFSEKLYLILDTNVLLSHLNFLEQLKDYAIKGVGKPVLVIPWIVMQELDNHKTRGNGRLADKARKAIRLLFSCFTSNHPRVRCQTMEETQTEVHNIAIKSNDDRILHCCLLYQLKTQGHSGVVVLFSNDLNLCSKAMGNGVKAADRTTLFKLLRGLCSQTPAKPVLSLNIPPPPTASLTSITSPSPHTPSPFTPTTPHMAVSPQGIPRVDPGLKRSKEVNSLLAEAEGVLHGALSVPLKQEMINAFDQLWPTMVFLKPPWSLKNQLFLIEKHWIAVYGQVLPYHAKMISNQLLLSIKNRPGVVTVEEAMLFTSRAVSLLHSFRERSYYANIIQESVANLDRITRKLSAIKKQFTALGGGTSPAAVKTPQISQVPVALVSPLDRTNTPTDSSTLPLLTMPSLTTTSVSLQHMKDKLTQAVQSPPTDTSRYLEWVLGLIHHSVIYSQSMVQETLASSQTPLDRANVSCFVRQIGELLSQIVSSLRNLLEQGVNIPRMQETLVAFDFFLCQALLVNSPLTIDIFFEMISLPEQRQLIQTALETYTAMLTELHTIDASFQL